MSDLPAHLPESAVQTEGIHAAVCCPTHFRNGLQRILLRNDDSSSVSAFHIRLEAPMILCRIHSLICRNQHKALCAVLPDRRLCCLMCSKYRCFDGPHRTCFHQGHMFMCRRMIDNLRTVSTEYLIQPRCTSHRTDQHLKVQPRPLSGQFLLNLIGIVLINIKND